jgi:hypothetical protein
MPPRNCFSERLLQCGDVLRPMRRREGDAQAGQSPGHGGIADREMKGRLASTDDLREILLKRGKELPVGPSGRAAVALRFSMGSLFPLS